MFRITRILIVDDLIFFRKEIRQGLEKDYEVDITEVSTVNDFKMKMHSCGYDAFDLIILDLNLPDGNGLAALRSFKERGKCAGQRFFVVSYDVNRALVPLAVKAGAGDIIAKPLPPGELIKRVEEVYPGTLVPRVSVGKKVRNMVERVALELRKADGEEGRVFFALVGAVPPDAFSAGDQDSEGEKGSRDQLPGLSASFPTSLGNMVRPLLGSREEAIDLSPYVCLLVIHGDDAAELLPRIKTITGELIGEGAVLMKEGDLVYRTVTYPDQGSDAVEIASRLDGAFSEAYTALFLPQVEEDEQQQVGEGEQEADEKEEAGQAVYKGQDAGTE